MAVGAVLLSTPQGTAEVDTVFDEAAVRRACLTYAGDQRLPPGEAVCRATRSALRNERLNHAVEIDPREPPPSFLGSD